MCDRLVPRVMPMGDSEVGSGFSSLQDCSTERDCGDPDPPPLLCLLICLSHFLYHLLPLWVLHPEGPKQQDLLIRVEMATCDHGNLFTTS